MYTARLHTPSHKTDAAHVQTYNEKVKNERYNVEHYIYSFTFDTKKPSI